MKKFEESAKNLKLAKQITFHITPDKALPK
jgi:hypothetical protein